mmetsp:Transcript_13450/g.38767  ORF Transcript_13450/g.38767 Transcript_13450/m.38767 type:complete len:439 (-) Transcript_13450:22-1338(-)|eukprot:CAMPEP_0176077890 /NCGR_PEP_ID=MMETSP0120_2-20121206/38950_1 /TAXON_ID=160619 /ORGANISM="Kryptoperidinium foliaceum, Strain CCMP 1326" /LENGTH=438 /DNA_ID=CAMNT_0017411633 /DNA_START=24 /DNA_END=1340 /DNA_ORIENTATION=-
MALRKVLLSLLAPALTVALDDASCSLDGGTDEESLVQLRGMAMGEDNDEPKHCDLPTEECHTSGNCRRCALDHMSRRKIYAVYPAGRTACLNSSTPYYFLVKKGDPRKLVLAFQDGLSCYDQASYDSPNACPKQPVLTPWAGMLDFADRKNPYMTSTIVRILYCSGDVHSGNTEQPWGPDGAKVQLRGYENANAAIEWASRQFPHLSELVLTGWSAGALALQYWADHIIRKFADRQPSVAVHADSFQGILFPPQALPLVYKKINAVYGNCGNAALRPEIQEKCKEGTLSWMDHWAETMKWHTSAVFTMTTSKADQMQLHVNQDIAGPYMPVPITAQMWYFESVLLMKGLAEKSPNNFRAFFVDGTFHGFLRRPQFYTATALGESATSGPHLRDWIAGFPARHGALLDHVCVGPAVNLTRASPVPEVANYCDKAFLPEA